MTEIIVTMSSTTVGGSEGGASSSIGTALGVATAARGYGDLTADIIQ